MRSIMQACNAKIWQRMMGQFESLGLPPQNLPEEALTQIYQVSVL